MPSPKTIKEKLDRIVAAWQMLAASKSFGGYTLAQFKAAIQSSYDTRTAEHEYEVQLKAVRTDRANADKASLNAVKRVVSGVLSDPTEGPDSDLYDAMGYVRESDRRSGLTHKGRPGKPADA